MYSVSLTCEFGHYKFIDEILESGIIKTLKLFHSALSADEVNDRIGSMQLLNGVCEKMLSEFNGHDSTSKAVLDLLHVEFQSPIGFFQKVVSTLQTTNDDSNASAQPQDQSRIVVEEKTYKFKGSWRFSRLEKMVDRTLQLEVNESYLATYVTLVVAAAKRDRDADAEADGDVGDAAAKNFAVEPEKAALGKVKDVEFTNSYNLLFRRMTKCVSSSYERMWTSGVNNTLIGVEKCVANFALWKSHQDNADQNLQLKKTATRIAKKMKLPYWILYHAGQLSSRRTFITRLMWEQLMENILGFRMSTPIQVRRILARAKNSVGRNMKVVLELGTKKTVDEAAFAS